MAPVFKKGKKYDAANYRLVSLTCICCKNFEHIKVSNTNKHLTFESILADCQHGFRSLRSCETQLVQFYHDMVSNLDRALNRGHKQTDVIYSLMGTGLHGENGLDPKTAISLLQTYVIPVLFYGLEVILPTGKALDTLEIQYKKLLKQILSLPSTTADPAVYLLSGLLPAEALIHKRMLTLY